VLEKSLRVLKPGGKLISISGHRIWICERHGIVLDPETVHAPVELSNQEESKTSSRELLFSFHESQWRSVTRDRSPHRFWDYSAVVDRVFPFESTNEAMAYVERGRAKGKVVVRVR